MIDLLLNILLLKVDAGTGMTMSPQRGMGYLGIHRVAYQLLKGDLVDGLVIDHLCKNRSCVNPNHLEQVTNKTNLDRGRSFLHHKEKTHCPQGHEYNEGNTYETATGWRQCKICQRSRALARYHKNKNVRP